MTRLAKGGHRASTRKQIYLIFTERCSKRHLAGRVVCVLWATWKEALGLRLRVYQFLARFLPLLPPTSASSGMCSLSSSASLDATEELLLIELLAVLFLLNLLPAALTILGACCGCRVVCALLLLMLLLVTFGPSTRPLITSVLFVLA